MLTAENEHTERPSPSIIHQVAAERSAVPLRTSGTRAQVVAGVLLISLRRIRVSYSTKLGLYKTNWMC